MQKRTSTTSNRGGTRSGAGRKPKYKEATTTVAFRVPISKVQQVKELVKKLLAN